MKCPIGTHIWTHAPQLVALFGKDVEPLVGGASLKEASHQGQAWRLCNLTLLPIPLCFWNMDTVWPVGFLTRPSLPVVVSSQPWWIYPSRKLSQSSPFSLKLLLGAPSITEIREKSRHLLWVDTIGTQQNTIHASMRNITARIFLKAVWEEKYPRKAACVAALVDAL